MSSPLAVHGGTPLIEQPAPHLQWPPITQATTEAVVQQLHRAVSIPDRSGVIAELEDRLAEYFGVRWVVLTSSGTAALHSAFASLELDDGDEVIVPAYTFHATATPLLHLRATPVLVDCDTTGNLDPAQVEAAITSATRAIVVTHMWGLPAQIETLRAIADRHGLDLIEDGSHAHGARVNGRKVGTFGRASAFSMNGPKSLSAGEGGFVLTNDEEVYYRVLLHGQYNKRCRNEIPADHPLHRFAVTGTGLKLRIHPLAAALAIDQLASLDAWLEQRRKNAEQMIQRLRELPGISVPDVPAGTAPSWYAMPLLYRPPHDDGPPIDVVARSVHPAWRVRRLRCRTRACSLQIHREPNTVLASGSRPGCARQKRSTETTVQRISLTEPLIIVAASMPASFAVWPGWSSLATALISPSRFPAMSSTAIMAQ